MAIPTHLAALKTQLVLDIERMHAEFMDAHGYPLEDIVVPCSPDDVDEVQMPLDDLYPSCNYRAVAKS